MERFQVCSRAHFASSVSFNLCAHYANPCVLRLLSNSSSMYVVPGLRARDFLSSATASLKMTFPPRNNQATSSKPVAKAMTDSEGWLSSKRSPRTKSKVSAIPTGSKAVKPAGKQRKPAKKVRAASKTARHGEAQNIIELDDDSNYEENIRARNGTTELDLFDDSSSEYGFEE